MDIIRISKILLLLFCTITSINAQEYQEYNRHGDASMKNEDYRDAKIWYEEGVFHCDRYSIDRLTEIWLKDENMRVSMRSLMNKCLNCLSIAASEQDTSAIRQVALYYRHGIGTAANSELANHWQSQLDRISEQEDQNAPRMPRREPMEFFVGYSYSSKMPFGLRVGGLSRRLGWYIKGQSNLVFPNVTPEEEVMTGNSSYQYVNMKRSSYLATAGMLIKCTPWLITSFGVGYAQHDWIYEYQTFGHNDLNQVGQFWEKQNDLSISGISAEVDAMARFGSFFLSAGLHTTNFQYLDVNAGVGFFF